MGKSRTETDTRDVEAPRPSNLTLERGSFVLAALGLAFCIAAPEASRYSAQWTISDSGSLIDVAMKAAYLLSWFFAVRHAATHGRVPLYRNRPLLACLVIAQTAGFALLIASSSGWETPDWAVLARSALLDSSIFLFAVFADFYLKTNMKTAISSFVVGVIVAGSVHACAAFLPFPMAACLILLFVPLSVSLLRLADRRVQAAEAWYASLPERDRALFEDEAPRSAPTSAPSDDEPSPASCKGLYATIALLSFIVAAIHLSWLGVQDGGATSVMVQVCAGLGTVLAGNILYATKRSLEDRSVIELTRLIVLPVAIGSLYVASLLSGSLMALVVIPLNIVYVAVLMLAWLAPFAYANAQQPVAVSCNAFLAKRMGVVVGIGIMRDVTVGDASWMSGLLVVGALTGLIFLSVGQFLHFKRQAEKSAALKPVQVSLDAEETRNLACSNVAERFRLTPREREVLELLVRGRTASYIAEELVISNTTAKTHIKHIYQKMDVQSKQMLLDIVEVELEHLASRCADDGIVL